MSPGLAPGAIIMAMGSPGATRSSTNTTTATPSRVAAAATRRWRAASAIMARATALRVSGLGDEGRLQRAGDVGRHLHGRFVDEGLRVLQERDHVALLGNIFVDGLP